MKKALSGALAFVFMVAVGIGAGYCIAAAEAIEKEFEKHRRHSQTVAKR
jgi:hypothetical protein